jgi:hypothetical protein
MLRSRQSGFDPANQGSIVDRVAKTVNVAEFLTFVGFCHRYQLGENVWRKGGVMQDCLDSLDFIG